MLSEQSHAEVGRNLSGDITILRQAVTAKALQRWHMLLIRMPVPHTPKLRKAQDLLMTTVT